MSDTKKAAKQSFLSKLMYGNKSDQSSSKSKDSGRGASAAKNIEAYKKRKAEKK